MKLYIASLLVLCCLSCAEPMAVTSSNGSNGNSSGSNTSSATTTEKSSTLSKDNAGNTVIPKDNHIHNTTNRKVTQTN